MFIDTLKIMGIGMLSIFIVMGLMFVTVKILNKVTNRIKKEDDDSEKGK